MRWILKISVLLLAGLFAGRLMAATFTAALDRDTLTLGESTVLALTFEGGQARQVPLPQVSGLQFSQNGTSQSMSIVNGAMSSTVTISFAVTPQRTGEFTIPALTTEVNGQKLSTTPLKMVVLKPEAPSAETINSGSETAYLKLSLPKQKLYVGETIVARLDLCLRDDVQNFANFHFTSTSAEGFSAGKMIDRQDQHKRVQAGNRSYEVIPIFLPLTVVKPGALTLGPFTASCVVVVPGQDLSNDPFAGIFNQGRQKQVTLTTETLNIEALPLPAQGQPENYSGAVGQFDMATTIGPTTVTVGDPITVRIQITGRGALDSIKLPAQAAWKQFKTYPPTIKQDNSDQFGFQGTKTFEQIISPLSQDIHELPPLTFSYFNPEDSQYHTLTHPAQPLVVQPAGTTPMVALAAAKPASEEKPQQDIFPIKDQPGTLKPPSLPLISQPVFWTFSSLPVLAFIGAFLWRNRVNHLAGNPRLRRQRMVAAILASGLTDLKQFAAANQSDEYFALLFRLLQEQLGERLDSPASAITENIVDEHASLRAAPAGLRQNLRELFQLCNQARYAPVRGSNELNSLTTRFETLVAELKQLKS